MTEDDKALVEVVKDVWGYAVFPDNLERFRAALAARGLKIVEAE